MQPRPIAITMGDPAGVGPEIIVKAATRLRERLDAGSLRLLVIGHQPALDHAAKALGHAPIPVAEPGPESPALAQLGVGDSATSIPLGAVSSAGGECAFRAVERGVQLAQAGKIGAIVTAPLNKEALNLAGHHFAGHTDMLATLTGSRDSVMMLAHGPMRVSHLTTHIALHDVPARLTAERLRRVVALTHEALLGLGIEAPHIAIAALNPHAGEGGLFGREDIDVTMPAVAAMRAEGLNISGPIPGDTVFVKLRGGQYDAVVAMYHDQGHIPVKLLGFQIDPATGTWTALNGVNITLGLPIIRTSVDHGTAFDIAGKGIANETSLIEAIEYAERLAATRAA
ncbi:MAG: 4-hydroxythreonine-4-phosphate dehydrogenase PdxA [Acetobacteraceae bacterium]